MDTSALFKIGYGLYVLTSGANDEDYANGRFKVKDNGCIINTVIQVTSDPCQIGIAVNKLNYTTDMIRSNRKFNISILSEDADFGIFKHFGFQSGKDINKFTNFTDVKRSPNGLLYITKHTNAFMSAYVKQELDLGTHFLFIGQLVEAQVLSDKATLTYDYYHKNIKPKPETAKKSGWRCKICGYIYEGENLPADYICPLCKHGAVDFERI